MDHCSPEVFEKETRKGNLEAIKGDKGRPPKLTEEAKAVILGVLAEQPDTYGRELRMMLEEVMVIAVATSTIYGFIDSVGYEKKPRFRSKQVPSKVNIEKWKHWKQEQA